MQPIGARRLTRSSRERMWAGVAGGLAEYFDVDPVVMRLIWVGATVVTGGFAIPAYIVLWIVMPRDDRVPPSSEPVGWTHAPADLRAGVEQFTEEVRGMASDLGVAPPRRTGAPSDGGSEATSGNEPTSTTTEPPAYESRVSTGRRTDDLGDPLLQPIVPPTPLAAPADIPGRRRRTAGVLLVAVGTIALLAQLGVFSWIRWNYAWPLILVAIGVALLVQQTSWRR